MSLIRQKSHTERLSIDDPNKSFPQIYNFCAKKRLLHKSARTLGKGLDSNLRLNKEFIDDFVRTEFEGTASFTKKPVSPANDTEYVSNDTVDERCSFHLIIMAILLSLYRLKLTQ